MDNEFPNNGVLNTYQNSGIDQLIRKSTHVPKVIPEYCEPAVIANMYLLRRFQRKLASKLAENEGIFHITKL